MSIAGSAYVFEVWELHLLWTYEYCQQINYHRILYCTMALNKTTQDKISENARKVAEYHKWLEGYTAEMDKLQDDTLREAGMFTLRMLHDRLMELPQEILLTHENGEYVHGTLDSYRGYFRYPAITFSSMSAKLSDFIGFVESVAEGRTVLEAYKGGDYVMSWDSLVWASKYGECSGRAVIGISDEGVVETFDAESYWRELREEYREQVPDWFSDKG